MDIQNIFGSRTIKRVATSTTIIIVNALSEWTDEFFGLIQGLCIAFILFVISIHLNKNEMQPRLLKRICLLYCSQQLGRLFLPENTATSMFGNILLAVALAIMMMMIYDKTNANCIDDLKSMLDSLLYLYSDSLDFSFSYGYFKITVCAFGMSIFFTARKAPNNQVAQFCWNLAAIVSANLLSIGISSMIQNGPIGLKFIQILASVPILGMIIPLLTSYLAYLAAIQLETLSPNLPSLFFCAMIWTYMLPESSRDWVGEMCFTYVIASITSTVTEYQPCGMILILVLAHYLDYIIEMYTKKKLES